MCRARKKSTRLSHTLRLSHTPFRELSERKHTLLVIGIVPSREHPAPQIIPERARP